VNNKRSAQNQERPPLDKDREKMAKGRRGETTRSYVIQKREKKKEGELGKNGTQKGATKKKDVKTEKEIDRTRNKKRSRPNST